MRMAIIAGNKQTRQGLRECYRDETKKIKKLIIIEVMKLVYVCGQTRTSLPNAGKPGVVNLTKVLAHSCGETMALLNKQTNF